MNHKLLLALILWMSVFFVFACEKATSPPEDTPTVIPLDGRGGGVIVYCRQPMRADLGEHQIYPLDSV